MIILLGYYKRRRDLTHEQFSHHWTTIHGQLVQTIPNFNRHVVRYVQHHLSPNGRFAVPDGLDFDGFSEVWFADQAAMDAIYADEFFRTAVVDDERQFIDMDATRLMVVDEQRVVVAGPGGN